MMTPTQEILARSLTKLSMHGYGDYQSIAPSTPTVPQLSVPDPGEEREEKGILDKFPWRAAMGGAMAGGMLGRSLTEQDLRKAQSGLAFHEGKGGPNHPQIMSSVMEGLSSGVSPEMVPEMQAKMQDPSWIRETLYKSPDLYDAELARLKSERWRALGKGPGLGTLGGAALGLGGGLLYNNYFGKESSDQLEESLNVLNAKHQAWKSGMGPALADADFLAPLEQLKARSAVQDAELAALKRNVGRGRSLPTSAKWGIGLSLGGLGLYGLARALRPENYRSEPEFGFHQKQAFRAPPPKPDVVPSAWNNHIFMGSHGSGAYGATQLAESPYGHTQISEGPHARMAAMNTARPGAQPAAGLLSKVRNVGAAAMTVVGKRPIR